MSKDKHYCDDKFQPETANTLSALDRKVHYKLYMLWAKDPRLSQEEIAEAMGVSRQAFAKYIRESKPLIPDIYKLFRLSKQREIPIHYFTDDNIDYMDNPKECAIPDSYIEDVNRELIPFLINSQLDIERKDGEKKLKQLLQEVGLDRGLVQRLTDAAVSDLTHALKETVSSILADKSNINEPVNPIDPDDLE